MENKIKIKISLRSVILLIVCMLSMHQNYAGIDRFVNNPVCDVPSTNFRLGAVCWASDSINTNNVPSGITYNASNLRGIVTLGINWDQLYFTSSYPANVAYTVEAVVEIKGWNPAGTQIVAVTETLKVHYNPVVNTTELDRSVYACTGVRRIQATIQSLKVNGIPIISTSANLPNNLYMTSEVVLERYRSFNTATVPTCSVSVSLAVDHQLKVNWASIRGAEEYDVEWTFVDQYSTPQSYNFTDNASRVTLPASLGTSYSIPMGYPGGYLVVRVRGRGRVLTTPFTQPTYGAWSIAASGSLSGVSSSHKYATGLEATKNWQYSMSFAEEGKHKEVISYYDGTLRNRQSITRLNTENVAIIGQTVYDHLGRPGVQVLPVPDQQSGTGYNPYNLAYRNDFNQDPSGNNYTWNDFDTSSASCDLLTRSMKNTSGASKYYSSNNPLKNSYYANFNNYLPDASNYPFTQVEYMPDQTGRIRRQGGVGMNHRLTGQDESANNITGKETRYYYATPFQVQLDRLFGNEVGYYTHYKKNAVIDANGQISVSYLDPAGRVIATALAGDTGNTANLNTLPSANTSTPLTVDLLDATQVSYEDMSVTSTATHMVTSAGTHSFHYSVATPSYTYCLPSGWCFDCVYDLSISVKDECGTEMIAGGPVSQTVGTINTACDSITFTLSPDPLNVSLQVGTYVIHKELKINQASLDYYTTQFLENSPCILPLDSFIAEQMSLIDTTECYMDCETCLDKLGSYSSHNNPAQQYDPNYDFMTLDEYTEARENCEKLCTQKTPCDILYNTMLNDVSPGGQYMTYEVDINGDYTVPDVLSLLNLSTGVLNRYTDVPAYLDADGSSSLVNISGVDYAPRNLPVGLFVQNWQSSWAKQLVDYHPEYCYYEYCISHESSYVYDQHMMNTGSYEAARDSGFLNPIGSHPNTTSYPIDHKDPYFSPYAGAPYTTMDAALDNFVTVPTTRDLWNFIDEMQDLQLNANTGTNTCWTDYDWSIFRAGYLSRKQEVFKNDMVASIGSSCPDFGSYGSNAFTTGEKTPRFIFDAFGALSNDSLMHNDVNISSSSTPNNLLNQAAGFIDASCDTICESYAHEWMWRLQGCSTSGMSDADSIQIRSRLILACTGNCDANNPFGGIPLDDIAFILEDVLGAGYMNDTCNPLLISNLPIPQHDYFGMVPMDSCACDKIKNAHVQFDVLSATGSLPSGVCSEQEYLVSLYGPAVSAVSFDQLECFCLQQGMIEEDTIITSTGVGPVTTIIAPNCDTYMSFYTSQYTYTAQSYALDLIDFFNQNWDLHGCTEGTYNMLGMVLSPNFLNFDCTGTDCFTTYTVENIINGAYMDAQHIVFHNSCGGSDCGFYVRNYRSGASPSGFNTGIGGSATCYDDVTLDAYTTNSFTINQDRIPHPTLPGQWISPMGNGMYVTVDGTFNGTPHDYYVWTDCVDSGMTVTCETSFDTTMMVPVELACEQCMNCSTLYAAYASLLTEYPFVGSIADEISRTQYLADYINLKYNTNYTYIQVRKQIALCDNSGQPDTLVFCKEPIFTNNHNPHQECLDFMVNTAIETANHLYEDYLDSVSDAFRERFIKKCLSPFETFTMDYTEKEYHYTLYYYDQAGNLIKTVPPAGVNVLVNQSSLDSVSYHRFYPTGHPVRVIPRHKMITDYNYTTLNQPALQNTPDGGLTKYWYDILGRLVVSQNAKQVAGYKYSYTYYDQLGRIMEVGEVTQTATDPVMTPALAANPGNLDNWIGDGTRTQVTCTYYDATTVSSLPFTGNAQDNLRNRVAYTTYEDTYNASATVYDMATHYSYDIHGNVKELVQENKGLATQSQDKKKIGYRYDLISGNVLQVSYQWGTKDQYYHQYSYDADNRLKDVRTSRDSIVWDLDARYIYYKHGPLARMELGDNKVQGTDYAYTLHGWIKAINSNTLNISRDIGSDGKDPGLSIGGNPNWYFARDAAAYSLGYYEGYTQGSVNYPADYKPIQTFSVTSYALLSTTDVSGNVIANTQKSLFNGNISYMVTTIPNCSTYNATKAIAAEPLGAVYRYDQLNRITKMTAFLDNAYLVTNNKWNTTAANNGQTYATGYSYDANGNLQKLRRRGDQAGANLLMDSLVYSYQVAGAGTPYYNGQSINRLGGITELQTTAGRYTGDIDNNSTYGYDNIGNLTSDAGEQINNIEWTVYGKVKKVTRTTGSLKSDLEFMYNASGQRVLKIEKPRNASGIRNQGSWIYTYYVHDAQGNIMSMYTLTYKKISGSDYQENMKVVNYVLYGSSRLGTKEDTLTLYKRKFTVSSWGTDSAFNSLTGISVTTLPSLDKNRAQRWTGYKEYEVNNHLGNVLATITDRKVQNSSSPYTLVDYWNPDINTLYDYYPFGAPMPGRNLALAPCSTVVTTITNTVVNEAFASGTGGFASVSGATLSNSAGTLKIQKTGTATAGWGASLSFPQIQGVSYSVSFTLGMGTCTGKSIEVRIKNPTGDVLSPTPGSTTYTTAGSKSFSFTANSTGTGSFQITMKDPNACDFNIDNVVITYQSDQVSTVCSGANDSYMFGFNGQEKLNEQYGEGDAYDFGARLYDPRLGRWMAKDPMAQKQPGWSPYKFCFDNPIIYKDPDGKEEFLTINITDEKTGKTVSVTVVVSQEIFWRGQAQPDNPWFESNGLHQYVDKQTTINLSRGEDGSLNFVSSETHLLNVVKYQTYFRSDGFANMKYNWTDFKGKGGFQAGGIYFTSKGGGADPTKFKSIYDADQIKDAESLISMVGGWNGHVGGVNLDKMDKIDDIISNVIRLSKANYEGLQKVEQTVEKEVDQRTTPETKVDTFYMDAYQRQNGGGLVGTYEAIPSKDTTEYRKRVEAAGGSVDKASPKK